MANNNLKKICILGLGYIGLPTACMVANNGYEVLGVDVDDDIINKLSKGELHIEEPDLEEIFLKAFNAKKLRVSNKMEACDIYIIAVPTPLNKNNKAELGYVASASEMIKNFIKKGDLVILESTSPPGTTRNIVGKIISDASSLAAGDDYYLAFCPERVLPGKIIFELINNDRVIGGINEKSAELAKEVYASFVKGCVYLTTLETSEFVKLAENTYRDVNIAFANELSDICSEYQINVWDIIKYANMHPRVNILNPGPGVGGHCIAIDPWFILENIRSKDTLIEKCRAINNSRPYNIAKKVLSIIKNIKNPKVTIFGITYKENVGDTRESPALVMIEELVNKKIDVAVYDPVAVNYKEKVFNLREALEGSDMLVLFVGHNEFKKISFDDMAELMRNRNIFDTRNFYASELAEKNGFNYFKI
ncbi:MAG: nucleotide sugar dehydrogenase [Candidatus Humimicrobiaceae bacterium]